MPCETFKIELSPGKAVTGRDRFDPDQGNLLWDKEDQYWSLAFFISDFFFF